MTSLDSRTSHAAGVPAVPAHAGPVARAVPGAVPAGHLEHALRRGVAVVGLLGIALVHVLDLPGKLEEVPYLGVAYLGLIAVSLVVAEMLVRRDDRRAWVLSALVSASVILGFVVNRTTGMPGAMDDIGNWLEPLGVASLFVEAVVLGVSGIALVRRPGADG